MPLRMPKFRFTRRLGKILLGVVATALILCGIAAWQVPKVLHNVLTQDVAKMLGRDVAVGKITFNPFTLTVRARDLAVAQPGSQTPLFKASELNVSAAWTSLFWFAPVVDRFTLRSPTLSIVREDVTRFNFSDVQQRVAEMTAPKPDEPPKPDEGLPRFSLNNMVIEGGVITLDDKVTGRKQVVDELAIGVPFISTFGYATDIDVQPRLHLRINGSPFDLTGVARPFDKVPSSTLRVAFSGLQLEKWADVWPMPLPFKLERALLDSNLQVVFEQPKDAPPKIRVVGDLGLRQFDLRDSAGESLAAWSALTVTRLELEPIARQVYVGSVDLWAPQVYARRYSNQHLNWQDVVDKLKQLGGPAPAAQAAGTPAAKPDAAARPAAAGATAVAGRPEAATATAGAGDPARPGAANPAAPDPAAKPATPKGAPAANPAAVATADPAQDARPDPAAPAAQASTHAAGHPAPAAQPASAATPTAPAPNGAPTAATATDTPPATDAPPKPAAPAEWKVTLDAFNIHEGELYVTDAISKLDYTLTGLAVTVEGVALPQVKGEPINLWLTVDNSTDGGWIRAKGPLVLQPLSLELALRMGNVALAPFAPAVRSLSPILLQDGRLGLTAQVHVLDKNGAVDASATGVRAELAQFKARDETLNPALDVALQQLVVTADRLAMGPGASNFTLAAAGIQGGGKLDLKGAFTPQPLSVKTSVDLSGLNVASFAPYFASSLNATVRAITLGAKGDAEFAAANGSAPMKAGWKGGVDITDVDLQDRVNKDDFLNWKRLGLSGMNVSVAGEKIVAGLGDIALDDFYGRILLNAQGRLNVMDLVAAPGQAGGSITQDTQTPGRRAEPPAPAAKGGGMPDISLNSVTLTRGRMTFTDRFVKPNYVAELSSIDGSITAVSSTNPQPAKVKVTGRVYTTAPLSISGVVQPFAKYLSLDLKASAKGVDLPRFNTYSAKYVGYPIKRGKLSVDLEYKIKDRALLATNHVVLNQLTFGDKTNSPDATKLPVLLAVALLKDSRGNIDINLPISGSLDDPEFSVGGIVVRVLLNLVVKAVTSPFSLLASAFGGGEELSYVEFAPGSAALTEDTLQRIDTLTKALVDRPALKMDLSGRADPKTDLDGLRQAWVDAQIRLAKARDVAPRGKKPNPAGVEVSGAERAKYLEKVYDDTDLKDKPRNFIGMAKSVPPQQMEEMLRAAAPVGDEQLRQLADARAQAVYEKLQAQEGLADRVFIVAPQLDADGIKDEGLPSRVDFSLK
ncbi:DUF748 domain-containing protein [Achromobacter ruhlandii]|uniref:DUF748 domain-containing protein n=8 Tax=Achromobacter ruhlandii TaxID=72557 RepID=UPI0006676491|nr:DUF748 domain-containing protein [Achromobacter ruhlandii]AKP91680.1 putative exported protein [Achromobacter xylosoxidans]MDC6091878.1 DUF748 domain-containing protein [Achromobacter ruhlandii]MDC6152798.1 DUF748 domain-containing protein [Achromobacter ruhlandii]MDD7981590.1 DUF748 domain-containing protein [Achromobacter ruhlandii]WIW01955.1 DUF748 domain-containing protein [Achromobacter ruhlandii]